jgi:hypothetical protein
VTKLFRERLAGAGIENLLLAALLVPLFALLCAEAVVSLHWRLVHDTPLLHYAAWQIAELGKVPYADVMETSMPGSFLLHIFIGRVFGWGDCAFQFANILWLSSLLALTWGILARIDKRVAWGGIVLYGLTYLGNGPWMALQRDGVAMLPIAAAVWMATSRWGQRRSASIFIGLAFGCAMSIKPHLGLGAPLVVMFPWKIAEGPLRAKLQPALEGALLGAVGAIVPVAVCLIWVISMGAFGNFFEVVTEYLPLHIQLTGDHQSVAGAERLKHLVSGYRKLGGHALWLAPLFLAAQRSVDPQWSRSSRSIGSLLVILAILYSVYPAFSGQFWDYHWMPFQYFAAIAAALMLARQAPNATVMQRVIPVILFAGFLFFHARPSPNFQAELAGAEVPAPKEGRVDEIARFLTENLRDGDTVQPLDWAGGAVHGMLIARVPAAQRFIYDYHFFHHLDRPVIQRWRQEFLTTFRTERPTYVIHFPGVRVSGLNTAPTWPDLEFELAENYEIALAGDGYAILQLQARP